MVKASGQIEKELGLLQQKTEEMAQSIEPLYEGYLKALSEASQRQLVLAAYHLCTQAYPDRFLALSWQQRNQLQQSLQAVAAQIYDQLAVQKERAQKMSRRPQRNQGLGFLQRLLEARAKPSKGIAHQSSEAERPDDEMDDYEDDGFASSDFEPIDYDDEYDSGLDDALNDDIEDDIDSELDPESDDESDGDHPADDLEFDMEVPAAEQRLTLSEEEDLLAALEGLARRSLQVSADPDEAEQPLAPIHLVKQQVLLEKAIRDVFRSISEEVNELLQKANVMPNFPKALMAAAADSGIMGDTVNAVPNVFTVSVRVMQGEASFDPGEEDDESIPQNRRPRRFDRRADRRFERERDGDRFDESARDRERAEETTDNTDNAAERARQRARDQSREHSRERASRFSREEALAARGLLPREVIEIESLPELAVINLRLSEVEFTDPTVSAWRSRLRQKLGDLKQLGVRYQKTQRSLETAQAEDAWRASWTVRREE
jgi:hypothetical protein